MKDKIYYQKKIIEKIEEERKKGEGDERKIGKDEKRKVKVSYEKGKDEEVKKIVI